MDDKNGKKKPPVDDNMIKQMNGIYYQ